MGTGSAGRAIATRLLQLGHQVTMGSRSAEGEALTEWVGGAGVGANGATFAGAAASAELVQPHLRDRLAGGPGRGRGGELDGKTLVDVANPLDFSRGMPPTLAVCNDDSLAERIQAAFPRTRVVKALNTVNCEVMVDPSRVRGDHSIFVCGDDDAAKAQVSALLEAIGWPPDSIVDLGDISAARGTEMYLPLWLRLYGVLGTPDFNIAIAR
ncbi:MAG: hypothetical protein U0R26_06820 [Solirubrobacterales bacterium]